MSWTLSINYFLHLIATVILLGSLAGVVLFALPALRKGEIGQNQWLNLQKRLVPWTNASLVILLLTGFFQMTNDPNYAGFLVFDGVWAWAMLLKHVAYAGMIAISFWLQFSLYPQVDRLELLIAKQPDLAQAEKEKLLARESNLLWINFGCALLVLLFTAIMTAV